MRVLNKLTLLAPLSVFLLTGWTEYPFSNGVLRQDAFVEFAGSTEQIANLKRIAREHGWPVDCESYQWGQHTLRLKLPRGTPRSLVEGNYGGKDHVPASKQLIVYHGRPVHAGCILLP